MADDKNAEQLSIEGIIDPHTGKSLADSRAVKKVTAHGDRISVTIELGYPASGWHSELKREIRAALRRQDVSIQIETRIASHSVQQGVSPLPGVKNIIAVASGKGGVGKSTVSANLALALAAEGASVALLDADIYGPSQPRMMGASSKPQSSDGKSMEPVMGHGLQTMSIGYLIDEDTPMIWRGPMVTQALEQLLKDTRWNAVDYLIIDLPPGTGDIQLTLAQRVPVTGSVVVTTPQDIALLDARKAYKMFDKVDIPVLGIIENMSTFLCPNCGHEEHIFGHGGGQRMADQYDIELLGNIPLSTRVREDADAGQPILVTDPDGEISLSFRDIGRRITAKLALKQKDYSAVFPNIVIHSG